MAIQQINTGGFANDPSADDIRTGGQIINTNFTQIRQIVIDNKSINKIFAGPASGSSGAPSFRSLVTDDIPDGIITTDKLSSALQTLLVPTGVVWPYGGSSAPTGFLLCDGSEVSRTTYANLFSTIGTSFGTGDGFTTFNLPDLRGRVPIGVDGTADRITSASTNGTNADTLGGTGGSETHTLTTSEMPAHQHGQMGHWFIPTFVGNNGSSSWYTNPSYVGNLTQTAGGGQAHSNTQPWIALNYIIKI